MVGFPIYDKVDNGPEFSKNLLEDSLPILITSQNCKIFILGFTAALSFTPGVAFADELPNVVQNIAMDAPKNETLRGKVGANALAALACVQASSCLKGAADYAAAHLSPKAAEEATKAAVANGNLKVATVVVCVFAGGWCAGQIADRVVRRAL